MTKAKKDRYRAGYERWEWKGKVGGDKDKEGVGVEARLRWSVAMLNPSPSLT